jgi:putative transposase
MVEADHPELSIAQQCVVLGISRSSYYYQPQEVPEDPDLIVLEAILQLALYSARYRKSS